MSKARFILPLIVLAQFACTSLWFACNAVMSDLVSSHGLAANALGHLTSAIQFGFITGTLSFALFNIVDRFSPSKIFFVCALLAATFNLGLFLEDHNLASLVLIRFATGFFLAGIYPVGMKIAADYFESGLGRSLGYLVGALVLGTSFPHLLNGFNHFYSWSGVILLTSAMSFFGGIIMLLFVPDGPYRSPSSKLDLTAFWKVFSNKKFRIAAFGYFGHMWELYTFWVFVPVFLVVYQDHHSIVLPVSVSILSFLIIAAGSLSCVLGSRLSEKHGESQVAFGSLFLSLLCCVIFPFVFYFTSVNVLLCFLVFWGMVVIADSPLFSTLVAKNADPQIKGTALTIVNCIGFSITILSIEFFTWSFGVSSSVYVFLLLAIGPILGLMHHLVLTRAK